MSAPVNVMREAAKQLAWRITRSRGCTCPAPIRIGASGEVVLLHRGACPLVDEHELPAAQRPRVYVGRRKK